MADDTVKEALDGVVKAIGFGIVSDFRELYDAVRNISSDIRDGNNILDQVNRNAKSIEKSLDDFQSRETRQRQSRQFKEAEDRLEGRSKLNAQRSEESMNRILKAIEELNKNLKLGAANQQEEDTGGSWMSDIAGGAMMAGAGGAFLKGAAKVVGKGLVGAAVVGGIAAVGAAGAYLMGAGSDEQSGGSVGPGSGPAGSGSVPTPASDLAKMGGGAAAVGASAGAAALIGRSTMSAKQKALAKIAPKVPSYLSKFGGRLATTIGLKSIPIFGALVGGYFSFSRFMSGDSWQAIGAEFAAGIAPDIGALGGPAGYVAGVASTLAIQTYLICRDIYQEENAIDIKNNVVPNFDDLDMSEKAQVLNSVKGAVEAYINSLLGRSSSSDATTGIAPSSTSGAAADTAPPAPAPSAAAPAAMAGAAPASDITGSALAAPPSTGGGEAGGAEEGGGITTGAAQDIAAQRAVTPEGQVPSNTYQQAAYTQNLLGASAPTTGGGEDTQGASPSDNVASFNTSSDQAGGYSSLDTLKNEIAAGEGDYGAYNRGKAGDSPDRSVNIQDMTVGQIMEMQSQRKLFAVGKYQFIPGTLREAVGYTGVSPDQKFNAATQEQLFPYLISDAKRPTLAGYISGRHDDVDAALNDLAAEFASVPQSNGRGRYDGDKAGNRASGGMQRAQKFKQILQGLKNANTGTATATPMASGGKVTPLTSDTPKAGRDLSTALQPPKSVSELEDEDKMTASQQTIDARKKQSGGGSPKEKAKNTISSYMPYMSYLFGTMTSELSSHVNGEVTADKAFKDAMNPLS
jgi:hypothetical protein